MKKIKFIAICVLLAITSSIRAEVLTVDVPEIEPGTEFDLTVSLENTTVVAGYQLRLYLPEGYSLAVNKKGRYIITLSERHDEDYVSSIQTTDDNAYSIVIYTNYPEYPIEGNSGELFTVKVKAEDYVSSDATAVFKRIYVTNSAGTDTPIDDVTFDLKLVNTGPVVTINEGVATVSGKVDASNIGSVNTALTEDVISIDMSSATIDASLATSDITSLQEGNMLVYLPASANSLAANNVVIGDACIKLQLKDMKPFSAPKPFTATSAEYTRNVTSRFGTICLPYAVSSDADVKYYSLEKIDGSTLYLTEKSDVAAGEPAVFENLPGNSAISVTAQDAQITGSVTTATDGELNLIGTFEKLVITDLAALAKSYYISKDQFHQANNSLTVNPFRAYFTYEGSSCSKVFNIAVDDDVTAIDAFKGEGRCNVFGIYDANGTRLKSLQKGINIVKYSDGNSQKIIVQ